MKVGVLGEGWSIVPYSSAEIFVSAVFKNIFFRSFFKKLSFFVQTKFTPPVFHAQTFVF